ncbi:chromate transporter [Petroclostridium sp. X23]|uniref:chromate transporter n=1 Tax=Petroclostridium sp. X23 TaxID=3045146 RepID=UPI0024AD97BC|nr:chromate transporter [Petroclostridium sp. X23]WHH56878.1 chromate transporter [Petroclostridium sp. X23]
MTLLLKLFIVFVKLSFFSFGGGYVMIPIMLKELEANHWATTAEVTDIVAIAGMCPGSVAVNAAVGLGYKVAGVGGVIAAFLGIALPCALVVIVVAVFFFKIYQYPAVQSALYGLRPVITGIIVFAAVKIALSSGIVAAAPGQMMENGYNINMGSVHLFELKSILMTVVAFFSLIKTKVHPIFVIIGAGVLGIVLF